MYDDAKEIFDGFDFYEEHGKTHKTGYEYWLGTGPSWTDWPSFMILFEGDSLDEEEIDICCWAIAICTLFNNSSDGL